MIAKNHISKNIFNKKKTKELKEDFNKIFNQILADITTSGKTLNVLNKDFIFNFKQKDLNKFRKFKSIAVIGMGGSILGTEAIHNFLGEKIDRTVTFTIKGRDGTTLQSLSIPNASLVGEQLNSTAAGNARLTLNYIGHQ